MTESIPKPTVPQQVKLEVKKELKKKDFSWVRKDYLVIGVLFVILGVISTVQVISLNRIEKTVRNSDVLAECFTPDTRCSNFSKENNKQTQEYFSNLTADASLCTLLTSGAVNTGEIAFEPGPIETYYTQCVADRSGPPPSPLSPAPIPVPNQ